MYTRLYTCLYTQFRVYRINMSGVTNMKSVRTAFFEISESNDYYHVEIRGYPIKKVTYKCNNASYEAYIYPTRELRDEEGTLLDDHYADFITLYIKRKKYGKSIYIWNDVSCENSAIYLCNTQRYFSHLIKKVFCNYTDIQIKNLSASLSSYVGRLDYV